MSTVLCMWCLMSQTLFYIQCVCVLAILNSGAGEHNFCREQRKERDRYFKTYSPVNRSNYEFVAKNSLRNVKHDQAEQNYKRLRSIVCTILFHCK